MRILLYTVTFCFLSFSVFSNSVQDNKKDQAEDYRQKGYKLQSAGNVKEALIYYQKAAQLYPQYREIYNDIGVAYESLGDRKKAIDMYKKALRIDSDYLPAYTNLALLYEAEGNIKEAANYWLGRYRKGRKGEYWWEKAKERLFKLGTYPEVHKEMLENEAINLSKNVVYKREQERLEKLEEANLRFKIGQKLFENGDYAGALEELNTAVSLSSNDKKLQAQISDVYDIVRRAYTKQKIRNYVEGAFERIDDNDYLAAEEKIRQALYIISRFSR